MPEVRKSVVSACLKDYRKGVPARDIAKNRGVSIGSIYYWLAKENVPLRGWAHGDDVRRKVVKDYLSNVPMKTIEKRYGISKSNVYRWTKQRRCGGSAYSEAKRKKVLADYILGLPIAKILQKHCINKKTLLKWRHDVGLLSMRRREYKK